MEKYPKVYHVGETRTVVIVDEETEWCNMVFLVDSEQPNDIHGMHREWDKGGYYTYTPHDLIKFYL